MSEKERVRVRVFEKGREYCILIVYLNKTSKEERKKKRKEERKKKLWRRRK